MKAEKGLVILGFGGHARSVAGVALASGVETVLFVDDDAKPGEAFLGFPVISKFDGPISQGWSCMPAAGDNSRRQRQFEFAAAAGWPLAKVIARDATVHFDAKSDPGCFIGHHAHVGPSAQVGKGCIINTGAIIEHESLVGDFSHVSVNAAVAGRSQLGSFVFVGAGATVIDSISIGDGITIGAGAAVVQSLTLPGIYAGCPARRISSARVKQVRAFRTGRDSA
jgi:UDP-N-acetylbacillosamine N-acetyltransferase